MAVTINASTSTGLVQSADTSGEIELQSNGTTALKVNTNEGVQILNCLGVGNATPSTSGAGITFPATQSASSDANTLDDYEEGTWTPTLVSTGGGAPAYSTQDGRYYKIGGIVYVFGVLGINGTLPAGNYTRIQGLPFSQSSTNSGVAIKYSGAQSIVSGEFISAAIGGGEISFIRNTGNGETGVVGLNASYVSTTFSVTFSTMYRVA